MPGRVVSDDVLSAFVGALLCSVDASCFISFYLAGISVDIKLSNVVC